MRRRERARWVNAGELWGSRAPDLVVRPSRRRSRALQLHRAALLAALAITSTACGRVGYDSQGRLDAAALVQPDASCDRAVDLCTELPRLDAPPSIDGALEPFLALSVIEPRGWTVTALPVTRVLHLKSAVTALPDGTVIGWPPNVDDPSAYPAFQPVPEEHGTAVVGLGSGAVLMSADAPRTAELLAARGLTVERVALSEFEKLEGCVTCLSVRLRG